MNKEMDLVEVLESISELINDKCEELESSLETEKQGFNFKYVDEDKCMAVGKIVAIQAQVELLDDIRCQVEDIVEKAITSQVEE